MTAPHDSSNESNDRPDTANLISEQQNLAHDATASIDSFVHGSSPVQDARGENTLLVSIRVGILPDIDAEEFFQLAQSAGAHILDHVILSRSRPDARLFMGSGKADELAAQVAAQNVGLVIVDHDLTPAQERNLEKVLQCRVIDRTGLILDIFAARARTYEGQLQVELAQLQHLSTRLIRGFANLEQQKGGIGLRGPGETQLETDRRLIRIRIGQLKDKIDKVRQTRRQGRAARQKAAIPTVALVGYSNAGKSTLFNRLCQSDVYAADQLFATLDPTLRRVEWDGIGTLILADTVGFIRDLRHQLIDSFRATLEETVTADLLLHVIDNSHPDSLQQIEAVDQVLFDIGADVPLLRVYNKIDVTHDLPRIVYGSKTVPERVYLSAHTGDGLDLLQQAVGERLLGVTESFELQLAPRFGTLHHHLHRLNAIRQEVYDEQGQLSLRVELAAPRLLLLLNQLHIRPHEIMSPEQTHRLTGQMTPNEDWMPKTNGP